MAEKTYETVRFVVDITLGYHCVAKRNESDHCTGRFGLVKNNFDKRGWFFNGNGYAEDTTAAELLDIAAFLREKNGETK